VGIFDWIRGRKTEAAAPAAIPEPGPPVEATRTEPRRVEPKRAAPSEPKRPPRPRKPGKKKQKNAPSPAVRPSMSEVLSVEEAERRYGAMFAKPAPVESAPAPEPEPEPEPEPIPVPLVLPSQEAKRERQPRRPSVDEERDATRAWAIVPHLEDLIARAEKATVEAANAPDLRAARRRFETEWESLGRPPRDRREDLESKKAARLEAFAARLKTFAAEEEQAMDALVEGRKALLSRADVIVAMEDLKAARDQLKALDVEWRASPKLDTKRFKPLKDAWDAQWQKLNVRSDARRAEGEQVRAGRLDQQRRLVESAETLAKATDLHAAAERMKGLQVQWKAIGFAGRTEETEALWARFRGAADSIFQRRNESDDAEERLNVEKKEALILKALALAEEGVPDPDHALDDLHRAWKKIGRVPKKQSDELWSRFKEACDAVRAPPSIAKEALGDAGGLRYNPFSGLARKE
jgi:hypothetical protein